jgi:hypothetical protein
VQQHISLSMCILRNVAPLWWIQWVNSHSVEKWIFVRHNIFSPHMSLLVSRPLGCTSWNHSVDKAAISVTKYVLKSRFLIIAAQHSLEYTYLKRYVVALSRFYSFFLQFSSILYFDKLWSVSRLIAMSWTFFNWEGLLLIVNKPKLQEKRVKSGQCNNISL